MRDRRSAADTIIGSDWHLKCEIVRILGAATTLFQHLTMASYLEFGKNYCVSAGKIHCRICGSSSSLYQEADEGSDATLSVFWDSVVVKKCYEEVQYH